MKRKIRYSIEWFPRKAPFFAIGFEQGDFRIYLWIVEIVFWRSF